MNKTIATVSAAVALGGSSVSAVMIPAIADLNVTSDLTYSSEYVARGIERADESFQPSLEATFGDFYAGIWANLPATNRDPGLTEMNYYGGFSLVVPEWVGESFDVGAKVYHYPGINARNAHEAYVGTQIDLPAVPGASVSTYYFYDFDVQAHTLEGSVGYSFSLEAWVPQSASIDLSVFLGKQFGGSMKHHNVRPNEDYSYYGVGLEVPYQLTEFSNVTAGVHYHTAEQITFENVSPDARGKNLFWSLSYTAGF